MDVLAPNSRFLISIQIFLFYSLFCSLVAANEFKLVATGQSTQEGYFSSAIHTLNDAVPWDDIWYLRTTLDLSVDGTWGDGVANRIHFYDILRFRFIWGNSVETKSFNSALGVSNIIFTVPGSPFSKQVVWTKEAWLKFFLDDACRRDYVQIYILRLLKTGKIH